MTARPQVVANRMNSYTGIVQMGSARAAELGYPTINIPLDDLSVSAVSGIFVAMVRVGEEQYEAVAYADRRRGVLEAHIFDFSADLYGWSITITLLKKIREHRKFTDDSILKKVIATDTASARAYFRK